MKKNFLIVPLLFLIITSYTQQLSQVTFSQATNFSWFSILTSQNTLVRISDDGKILEYGTEEQALNNRNYYAQKLRPYTGVVTYYQNDPDSTLNGKIKNIGTCYFTYYGSHDYPERISKLKSAGGLSFDYYRKFDDALTAGKIKTFGSNIITYFTSFDNEALKGKLKSVGNTSIQYYSSFDNSSLKGKLKSIGSYRYEWGSTLAGTGLNYFLKTGSQRQLINGVTYIPQ